MKTNWFFNLILVSISIGIWTIATNLLFFNYHITNEKIYVSGGVEVEGDIGISGNVGINDRFPISVEVSGKIDTDTSISGRIYTDTSISNITPVDVDVKVKNSGLFESIPIHVSR